MPIRWVIFDGIDVVLTMKKPHARAITKHLIPGHGGFLSA